MMQLDLFGSDATVEDTMLAAMKAGIERLAQHMEAGVDQRTAERMVVEELRPRVKVAALPSVTHLPGYYESTKGTVVAANLPEGWQLIDDGWNGLTLKAPEGQEFPSSGRFPYSSREEGRVSLDAAIAKAEVVCRRLMAGTWTSFITIGPNYMVDRERFEEFLLAWRAGAWGKRLPKNARHYLLHLATDGVRQQFTADLRPPKVALKRALDSIKSESEPEDVDELEDDDDE